MSYVDSLVSQISDNLSDIESTLAVLAASIKLTRQSLAEGRLADIPGGKLVVDTLLIPCTDLAEDCNAALHTFVANCRLQVAYAGSPDNLRAAADTIDSKLVDVAKNLSPTLVLGKIPSALDTNYSDGEASERYEHAIDGRDAAVLDIANQSSPVASALRDLADGIEGFYLQLSGIIAGAMLTVAGIATALLAFQADAAVAAATVGTAGAAAPSALIPIILKAVAVIEIVAGVAGLLISKAQLDTNLDQTKRSIQLNLGATVAKWPKVISE